MDTWSIKMERGNQRFHILRIENIIGLYIFRENRNRFIKNPEIFSGFYYFLSRTISSIQSTQIMIKPYLYP